jgi:hypothetical protein
MSYSQQNRTAIPRVSLGYTPRVEPPENVKRVEFTEPCWRCNARGECRHRRSFAPESQAESLSA